MERDQPYANTPSLDRLRQMAALHCPPQKWFDADEEDLFERPYPNDRDKDWWMGD